MAWVAKDHRLWRPPNLDLSLYHIPAVSLDCSNHAGPQPCPSQNEVSNSYLLRIRKIYALHIEGIQEMEAAAFPAIVDFLGAGKGGMMGTHCLRVDAWLWSG